MKRLENEQMERLEGGTSKDLDCTIAAGSLILLSAFSLVAIIGTGGAAGLAVAGWGVGYANGLYSVAKTCNIL